MSRRRLILDLLARPRTVRYGPHASQRADLHLPRPGGEPHALVVLVHGGAWGSKYGRVVMRGLAGDLARRGYAVWNIEYRRLGRKRLGRPGGGGWPQSFEDVAAAVDRLADLDAPLDLARVAGLGHSAGGQLVLWAAGRYKLGPGSPGAGPRVRLVAAIAQAGVVDMTASHAAAPHGAVDDLMGGSPAEVPDRYEIGDPIRLVPLALPVLLVHGTDDATVSIERSRAYSAAARAAGGDVTLVEIPGKPGRHGAHIDPAGPAYAAARTWLEEVLPPAGPGPVADIEKPHPRGGASP